MKRSDLEHLIRAASSLINEYEFIIVGSQSILGSTPNAPADLLESDEADIYPISFSQEKIDIIDGSLGEMSPFHSHFGYYAQGVSPETACLPTGWESRLVQIQNENTDSKIGWCISPLDLAASKLVANRPKDIAFVSNMLTHGIINKTDLIKSVNDLPIDQDRVLAISTIVAGMNSNSSKPTM